MNKKILMISFHFPPLAGSSGIQRSLRLVQQLPSHGWQALVLTVTPQAYERTSDDLVDEVPPGIHIRRSFALDAARQLSFRGRYMAATARPDRWISWKYFGVRDALQMIKVHRPDVIWSTYPIATAHALAAEVQRRSGLPWVADFRDPMVQDGFPPDPVTRAQLQTLEQQVMDRAALVTLTTPSAARSYRARYAHSKARIELLENGYDEATFAGMSAPSQSLNPGALTLLHSGIVYPSERDPTQLFEAVARLRDQGLLRPGQLKLRFRAPVHDRLLQDLAQRFNIAEFVEALPPIPYGAALTEMLQADALLVLQASNCNEQIPAKIYEYLRAGRPILCLSDPAGDTSRVLMDAGISSQCRLDSADEIAAFLPGYLAALRAFQAPTALAAAIHAASRESRTAALATLLDELI